MNMNKQNLTRTVLVVAGMLAGCSGGGYGGGSGGGSAAAPATPAPVVDSFTQNVQMVTATQSEVAAPVAVDGLVVVDADLAAPVAVY
jgi:hypothetical protein